MISIPIRVLLLLVSFFTLWYTMRKIRKSQMQIEDTVFWVCFFWFVLFLAIFPSVGVWFASMLGIYSPVNFVFLIFIFILLLKIFFQSIKISQLDKKIKSLTQRIAVDSSVEEL
ncbi:MAG: DUF2304 domain-containing protein [Defluviitaleaceae bacterium]|nr:DUF2304 domain-containing protein [Defluviitaleaceae bacterium]